MNITTRWTRVALGPGPLMSNHSDYCDQVNQREPTQRMAQYKWSSVWTVELLSVKEKGCIVGRGDTVGEAGDLQA